MSALAVGVVPVAGVTSPASAQPNACDADGDGTSGGVETTELSNGSDDLADEIEDDRGVTVGDPGDGYRWRVTVCTEGSEIEVLSSPVRALAPQAVYWQVTALGLALDSVRDQTRPPELLVWPQVDGRQVVGLETWLAIDEANSAWRTLQGSATFGEVTVSTTAVPQSVVWEFSDEIVRCDSPGVEYTPGASGPAPCGKDWDHTSEVVPQRLRVWIEYRVSWSSSIGQSGALASLLAGRSHGPVGLAVGEVQAVGVWGDREPPTGSAPGGDPDLGGRAECTLLMMASGECSTGSDVPDGGSDGSECRLKLKFWEAARDCITEGVDAIIDVGEWILDEGWELFYNSLPEGVRRVVDEILSFLAGCAEYGIEAIGGIKDMVTHALSAARDPVGFLREQLALAKEIAGALQEDPAGFAKQFFGDLIDYDLLQSDPTKWAGKIGCELALGLVTGGGAAATGRFARIFDNIGDFTEAIRDWRRRRNRGDDSDNDTPWLCRRNSFPAGTLVLLRDKVYRPIELIEPGELVVTYDTEAGVWSRRPVLAQWSAVHGRSLATVMLADGSSVTSTDDHRYWVDSDNSWVEADRLDPGDRLVGPTGSRTVADVNLHPPTPTVVWEIDTAVDDTFVVRVGGAGVVVHNGCGDPPSTDAIDDMFQRHPELEGLPKTSVEDILGAWDRYDGDKTPDEWLEAYARIRKNNTGGSTFELAGLEDLGITDSVKKLYDDIDGIDDFIPDHSEILPDGSLYFAEVKNYVARPLQPSSNAGQMLEYLINKADDGLPGIFDLVINENTQLSPSFQRLIRDAEFAGVTVNITRLPGPGDG
jgi:hypothetical protein